jgi:hypothetical protein|uniref:Helicase ATPase REPLICATION n=1 Tax=Podoviridae sp. ctz6O13 TaxID=2827757 RepID=A0A8S5TJZ1_9CAUD|nr:MAG TPA: Helicase ATPase REPLICATION [Podoviridae sp. ctz6O13]
MKARDKDKEPCVNYKCVNDCNTMIAIYDPVKMQQKEHHGYKMDKMLGRFRVCQILKNRFGECDVEVGINFFGEINYFKEMPRPDEITDYEKYNSPEYILEEMSNATYV